MSAYPRTDLEELLKCKVCKIKFTHKDEPKSLPCGHTICNGCDDSIDSRMKSIEKRTFKCLVRSCKREHVKPAEGLPSNQLAIKLVSLQPKEIYRGDNMESLKTHLATIEQLVSRLNIVAGSGVMKINEYYSQLKVKLSQAADERIKEIKQLNVILLRQIESYENDCIERFVAACSQNEMKLIEIETFLAHKKSYLIDRLDSKNTDLIVKSNKKAVKFIQKLEEEEMNLKNCIFNNKSVEFEPGKARMDVNLVGTVSCRPLSELARKNTNFKSKQINTIYNVIYLIKVSQLAGIIGTIQNFTCLD